MKLGIITYDTRHLKTEQVGLGLHQLGRYQMEFFALPFVERAARTILFAHRPEMASGAHSADVAAAVGAAYTPVASVAEISADAADFFIIAGAGLLPAEWVERTSGRVVNSHPGIIPLVRGLDAFKWAILDGMPIGNTLHFIDAEADAGEVFAQSLTPVFSSDSLEDFARRHYELEIQMMVDFEAFLLRSEEFAANRGVYEIRPARMRMKAEQQELLRPAFEAYRAKFSRD